MTAETHCALCVGLGPLLTSHVLPAFVFRWLRETSATGHMRFATAPNKRVQDGLKLPWLCKACEARLSNFEALFATKLFHPFNENGRITVRYSEWLSQFCVSVSWRVLKYYLGETGLTQLSAEQQEEIASRALARWSAFLLGAAPHPAEFEQHLLPLDVVKSHTVGGLPNNINRYLLRAIDMDVASSDSIAFTYAKLGKFAIFGFIQPPKDRWIGSKVSVRSGIIQPREYKLPRNLIDYISSRARKYADLEAGLSDVQVKKIEEDVLRNPDRFRTSGTAEAMLEDERLFGTEAILRKP